MNVRIKLFAAAKQMAGVEEIDVVVPGGATVSQLREAAEEQYPQLQRLIQHAMFAIDAEYAEPKQTVPESAEVAIIPPVSGG